MEACDRNDTGVEQFRETTAFGFYWSYVVREGGDVIGKIDIESDLEGVIQVREERYRVHRDGYSHGHLKLEHDEGTLGEATPPSLYTHSFRLQFEGVEYKLHELPGWRRRFSLLRGSTEIGRLEGRGILSRQLTLRVDEFLPGALRGFILFAAILFWLEESGLGSENWSW